jgi:hypothetical protein
MSRPVRDPRAEVDAVQCLVGLLLAAGIAIFRLDAGDDAAQIEVEAGAHAVSDAVDGLVALIVAGVDAIVVPLAGAEGVVPDQTLDAKAGERTARVLRERGSGDGAGQKSGQNKFTH